MSRTIEPGISLLTAAEIRVVVLPIGPMPRDTFDAYLDVFNTHRHVPLNATRSFYQGGPKSPFPHLPYKTGAMHFRFIQADDARRRTRIADLHCHRQIVAVLGLLHCPLVEDLLAAHSEFGRASRQWPEALVARCCAFEPSPLHLAAPGCPSLSDLMVFPAGHLDQHLEVYMHEFAAAVLAAVEDVVLNASVSSIKLNTYVDSGDFLGSLAQIEEGLRKLNINEEELKEKKRWGRLQKSKGDWALMAGSPRDAFEHYKSAMDLSRVSGDAIWYGAAVEGLAHARVFEALIAARPAAAGAGAAAARPAASPPVPGAIAVPVAAVPEAAAASTPAAAAEQPMDFTLAGAAAVDEAANATPGSATAAAAADVNHAAAPAAGAAETAAGGNFAAAEAAATSSSSTVQPLYTLTSAVSADLLPSLVAVAAAAAGSPAASHRGAETAAAAAADAPIAAGAAASSDDAPSSARTAPAADRSAVGASGSSAASSTVPVASTSHHVAASCAASTSSSTTAAAAAGAAAGAPAGGCSGCSYSLSGPAVWSVLARAELEGEVRELLGEARNWYKKKGGALVLQIEQQLKLCRFMAGLHGPLGCRRQACEAVGLILDSLAGLSLQDDRAVALMEAGQLLGLVGCGRKRLLLLWAALDMFRSAAADKGHSEAGAMLRLALKGLEPPEQPRQQDPDDLPRIHWAMKRFIAWQQQHLAAAQQQQQAAASQPRSGTAAAAAAGSSPLKLGPAAGSSVGASSGPQSSSGSPQQQQQQFQQLLGPQLQLLSPEQAALLQRLCGEWADHQHAAGFTNAKVWGLVGRSSGLGGLGGSDWLNPWGSVLVAVLEAVVNVAKAANAPVETWEAAAALLRESYPLLPQALQVSLMETCGAAGSAMGSRARLRPGPGPGPQVQLKRVLPGPACLQPLHLSGSDVAPSSGPRRAEAAGGSATGPFIFNPYAAKRQVTSAAAAAEAALPEWVCGDEGWVEVLLVNPCATPLKLEQLQLQVQPMPAPTPQQLQQFKGAPGTTAILAGQQLFKATDAAACADAAARSSGQAQGSGDKQHQQQQQGRQGSGDGSGASDAGSQASSSSSAVVQRRSVSVSLAAGSKPVRVLLSYTPSKPGLMAVTGIQASCWGVSWYQPFVQLPRLAAAAGHDALAPQGAFTVAVQPPLPLIKATLHGSEVQVVQPAEEELAGFCGSSSSNSFTSTASPTTAAAAAAGAAGAWSAAAGGSSAAAGTAAAAAAAAAAGVSELDKKVTTVFVFEGQTLSWTLNLTNISAQAVTGCKVTILNAKGLVVRPLNPAPSGSAAAAAWQQQQQQLPASFAGAHMEVQEQGVAGGLPLNPGRSLSLPVAVTVGKPPGDAFDAVMLQVRITYHGTATSTTTTSSTSSTSSSSSSSTEPQIIGRRLTLPIRLSIQPTLQVKAIRFLQQTLPLRNGLRHSKPRSLITHHQTHHPSRQDNRTEGPAAAAAGFSTEGSRQQQGVAGVAAAATSGGGGGSAAGGFGPVSPSSSGALLRRHPSHHVRNSSDGAVPVMAGMGVGVGVGAMLMSHSPTRRPMGLQQGSAGLEGGLGGGFGGGLGGLASADQVGSAAAGGDDSGSSGSLQQLQFEAASAAAAGGSSPPHDAAAGRAGRPAAGKGSGGSGVGAGAGAVGSLAVGSEAVLELAVRNASERYFRAWLGCLPDRLSAESALSVVAVLEPGDTQKLMAVLPAAAAAAASGSGLSGPSGPASPGSAAAAAGSSGGLAQGLTEPSRLVCAEGLVERLLVCWEMITGAAGAAGQLPRGKVQLAPVDVAANLTPGAVAALCPSPLSLRLSALPAAAAAPGTSCPGELVDLMSLASGSLSGLSGPPGSSGLRLSGLGSGSSGLAGLQAGGVASGTAASGWLPGLSGPLWGLHMKVGQWLTLELEITYSSSIVASAIAVAAAGGSSSTTTTNDAAQLDSGNSSCSASQEEPLLLQVTLYAADVLANLGSSSGGSGGGSSTGQQQPGTPMASVAGIGGLAGHNLLGRGSSLGGQAFAQSLAAGSAGLNHNSQGIAGGGLGGYVAQGLIDPGVYVAGCYSSLQVQVGPGSKELQRLQVLLVQPGLYQMGVADVVRVGGGAAGGGSAAGGVGASGGRVAGEKGRVYFNQDRMYVLVSS